MFSIRAVDLPVVLYRDLPGNGEGFEELAQTHGMQSLPDREGDPGEPNRPIFFFRFLLRRQKQGEAGQIELRDSRQIYDQVTTLPGWDPSCRFQYRQITGLIRHSGIILVLVHGFLPLLIRVSLSPYFFLYSPSSQALCQESH